MTADTQNERDLDVPAVREDARSAVARGDDISDAVRDIVLRALSHRPLERENISQVMQTVLEGAAEGAPESSVETTEALKRAVAGIDAAMMSAAEASRLAIEEAAGRADEFSETDLKQALDDLVELDKLFVDAIGDLLKSGAATSGEILKDLITHIQRTGTDTGRSVRGSLSALNQTVSRVRRPDLSDVHKTARTGLATIASIGSGILAGLSESLAPPAKDDDTKDSAAPEKS